MSKNNPVKGQKIPLKFRPQDYEARWQKFWDEHAIYKTPEINNDN